MKEIIVLGDIEMGAGNLTDDFIADKLLAHLILNLSKSKHQVDLILNGDTFDFLKCPFQDKDGKLTYPRHITKEVSLNKLELIYKAHTKVFNALKSFVTKSNKDIYFIIGNHDFDLTFRSIQTKIKKYLNKKKNIYFLKKYTHKSIYVEHGQQYDFLSKVKFDKLLVKYKEKKILNLPFAYFGLITRFMNLKEGHPFAERMMPRPTFLSLTPHIHKEISLRSAKYLIKSILYYPIRYYSDPTYIFPKNLLKEFFKRVKSLHWDVDQIIPIFKKRKKYLMRKKKIIVLGHIHEYFVDKKRKATIIHPGSWRDEYDLDYATRILTPRTKRYVKIICNGDNHPEYKIIKIKNKRKKLNFNTVIKDEVKHLKKVAEAEGYKPVFY